MERRARHAGRLEYARPLQCPQPRHGHARLRSLPANLQSQDDPFDITSQNPFSGVSLPDFSVQLQNKCAGVKRRQEILHDSEEIVVLSGQYLSHHPTCCGKDFKTLPVPLNPCVPAGRAVRLSPVLNLAVTPPSPMCLRTALLMPLPLLMSACSVPSTGRKKSRRINGSILRI